jgi:hypothetical protein
MTIVQVSLRDEPEHIDNFLRACGAVIDTSLPVDVMANRFRVPDTFSFSFGGLAPLPLDGARGVLLALDSERRREVEVGTWGCPPTSDAHVMRMRWVVPADGSEQAAGWRDAPPRLLEVAVSLVCEGVPEGWFAAAAGSVRWSKLLWFAANHTHSATEPYGAIFASADGSVTRPPWQDVSQLVGVNFLSFNGWVSETTNPASMRPLPVDDPAFSDRSRTSRAALHEPSGA